MIEAIILKLCFGLEEMERLKQLPVYSNYVILAEVEEEEEEEEEEETESCFFVRVEEW